MGPIVNGYLEHSQRYLTYCQRYLTHCQSYLKHSASMKAVLLLSLLVVGAFAAPESRFLCSECVDEMHKLGHMVKMGAVVIHDYIRDNYCPTLGGHQHFCRESLSRYYVGMLYAVVEHYFVDGALHVCQTGGVCEAT